MTTQTEDTIRTVTSWEWPCKRKGYNVIAAGRCRDTIDEKLCKNCKYKEKGELFGELAYEPREELTIIEVEELPDYPVCIGSFRKDKVKVCPNGVTDNILTRARRCEYRQTYKGKGRKRSLCLFGVNFGEEEK